MHEAFPFTRFIDILFPMKQLPIAMLAGVFIFCASCGSVDMAKRYPNLVADADPISAGNIEAVFDRVFSSKLNKVEIEIIFYPRLNAVALEFKQDFVLHRQFWDEAGRKQFATALEQYKEDYAARNLNDRYRKTRAIYGRVKGRMEWQAFKYSTTHIAFPTIELGYRFRNKTPFFATFMPSVKEKLDDSDSAPPGDSQQVIMYFTRAQADELVKLFDQPYLMGLLGHRSGLQFDELPEADYSLEQENGEENRGDENTPGDMKN
jgi:hypothetical protein